MLAYRHCSASSAGSFAFFALSTLYAQGVWADPLALVTVRLDAPLSCPSLSTLNQELRRDLEGSEVPGERLAVEARISQVGATEWQALVVSESQWGREQRWLKAVDCDALVAATSLIIAMQIDPETAASHAIKAEGSRLPASPIATAQEPQTPRSEPLPVTPPNRQPWQGSGDTALDAAPSSKRGASSSARRLAGIVAAWVGGDYGSLPTTTAAFGGTIGLGIGDWRIETAMGWWLPRHKELGGSGAHADTTAEFGMWAAAARTCWQLWGVDGSVLGPCVGVEAARRRGSAAAIAEPKPIERWDGATVVALRADHWLSQAWGLRLDLDVLVPWKRTWFGFYEPGHRIDVFRPAGAPLRALVGLEWRFW